MPAPSHGSRMLLSAAGAASSIVSLPFPCPTKPAASQELHELFGEALGESADDPYAREVCEAMRLHDAVEHKAPLTDGLRWSKDERARRLLSIKAICHRCLMDKKDVLRSGRLADQRHSVLHLAISLFDRYIIAKAPPPSEYREMSACCLWVALKLDLLQMQMRVVTLDVRVVWRLAAGSDHDLCTRVPAAETKLFQTLDWRLTVCTPADWLNRFAYAAPPSPVRVVALTEDEHEHEATDVLTIATELLDCALLLAPLWQRHRHAGAGDDAVPGAGLSSISAQMQAAAAIYMAREELGLLPWGARHERRTGITRAQVERSAPAFRQLRARHGQRLQELQERRQPGFINHGPHHALVSPTSIAVHPKKRFKLEQHETPCAYKQHEAWPAALDTEPDSPSSSDSSSPELQSPSMHSPSF